MMSPTKGGGDLPKGDISPYAYLVKWVTRGRGQKSQNIGDIIYKRPHILLHEFFELPVYYFT